MAKGGKKGRTKEQVALYAEIVRLMGTLNQRSKESVALAQKLAEAQANMPEILKRLSEQAKNANNGVHDLSEGQKKLGENTRGVLGQLMQFELSLRRIQSGLKGLRRTATFADQIANSTNQFLNMAYAINVSATEMKKLQYGTMKWGIGANEAIGLVKGLAVDIASLRMGKGGGRLSELIRTWGLNISGVESPIELLSKYQEKYQSLQAWQRPLFQQQAGISDNMAYRMGSMSREEFRKHLENTDTGDWNKEGTREASDKVIQSEAEEKITAELADKALLESANGITVATHETISKIYDFMREHPWVSVAKGGIEAAGSLGSTALGTKAILDIFRKGKAVQTAGGALAGAEALGEAGVTAAGGLGVLGTLGIIAAAVGVVAGGWWMVKKISDNSEDNNRGKNIGQSSEQAIADAQARLDKARAELLYQTKYGDSGKIERARKEVEEAEENLARVKANTKAYDELVVSMRGTLA